jgi:LPXTG-motif cell wall-anchored protein
MDLTLTYEKEGVLPDEGQTQTQLTVHYVDEAGNKLAADGHQSGQVGTLYTLEVPTIKGYYLPETQQAYLTGMYVGNQMTLTLTYQKTGNVPDENQTQTQLTVHYVDEQGQTIAKTTTQSGKIGTGYTVVAPKITGYWLPETEQAHLVGTYQGNQMTLTLTYQKTGSVPDENQTQTQLTVHYVDEQGQKIAVDTQQQGRLGTPFTITAPSITGYHLADQHQAITQGTYQGNQMTLTLVYQKKQTTQPSKPTETVTPEHPTVKPHTNGTSKQTVVLQRPATKAQVVVKGNTQSSEAKPSVQQLGTKMMTKQQQQVLPQTDEAEPTVSIGLGAMLMLLAGLLGIKSKRDLEQ